MGGRVVGLVISDLETGCLPDCKPPAIELPPQGIITQEVVRALLALLGCSCGTAVASLLGLLLLWIGSKSFLLAAALEELSEAGLADIDCCTIATNDFDVILDCAIMVADVVDDTPNQATIGLCWL